MRLRFLAVAVAMTLVACSGDEDHAAAVDPNQLKDTGVVDSTVDTGTDEDTGADTEIADTGAKVDGASDAKTDATDGGVDSTIGDAGSDAKTDALFDVPADVDAAVVLTCTDTVKSGDETDVDCGGSCRVLGKKCAEGKTCAVDADCVEGKCGATSKQCLAPACNDGVKNGLETDIDCGGPSCGKCGDGKRCNFNAECTSGVCGAGNICSAPTCTDGVKNGSESDIDCGASCPKKCLIGANCGGPADCASNVCSGTCRCPGGMTQLNVPTGSGTYCIDQIEVTNADYAAFLTSGFADPTAQDPVLCKEWNTSFVPTSSWPAAAGLEGHPVRGVDWCDALAFCKAKGKILCGKIGGGATPVSSYNDEKVSKWMNACSQGVNAYPYGSTYSSSVCNGADKWSDAGTPSTWAVINGTIYQNTACIGGPASNVYQLSGNVAEWEDACEPFSGDAGSSGAGALDTCLVRGGSFSSNAADLQCGAKRSVTRSTRAADIGFRCCL